jgi:hypothetical protein
VVKRLVVRISGFELDKAAAQQLTAIPQGLSIESTADDRMARLLRQYRPGERVRAVEAIVYGTGEEVPEGATGFVQRTNVNGCAPLVTVAWEGIPAIPHPCSVESLDPVDRRVD